jgi:hypothetical protein
MCMSLTDYHMTYTSTEQVSEKYKIGDSVTIDKNRTNDLQRSEEEDNKIQHFALTDVHIISILRIIYLKHVE